MPSSRRSNRIIVLGGYGLFGGKITRALADEPIELVIAGRSVDKANRFCAEVGGTRANLQPLALDAHGPAFAQQLAQLSPKVLIHTCGPFQGQRYQVADHCIEQGCHYLDLADGREFVAGFGSPDRNARAAAKGVVALSGVSSVPALSSSVVTHLSGQMERIKQIESAIYPGNRTERGRATVESILSYLGAPIKVWEGGVWQHVFGWGRHRRVEFAPPIGARRLADCDVPDLALFPDFFKASTVRFQAGLELGPLHHVLRLAGWLRRRGLVGDWGRHSGWIFPLSETFKRWGTDIGGMSVRVIGDQAGQPIWREWQLLATHGYGPQVPTLPARVLTRRLLRGTELPTVGARPCLTEFSLSEFLAEADSRYLTTQISNSVPGTRFGSIS